MGRLAEVDSFERTSDGATVKVDPGGGALVTADFCEPAGDDSQPLSGDTTVLVPCSGTGREAAVACSDPNNNNHKAAAGERRIYARNTSGAAVAEVHLKNDGSIVIAVLDVSSPITIQSTGAIQVNSPNVLLGAGGRQVACVGDIVAGSFRALATAPGSPIVPVPPATPTPTGGIPFVGKIISGVQGVEAGTGTGA